MSGRNWRILEGWTRPSLRESLTVTGSREISTSKVDAKLGEQTKAP
jgi:hypothetical protein